MTRRIHWTAEKYKLALRGDTLPGLRSVVKGFEASDGYDLRSVDSFTKSQKARIRKYYDYVHQLEAQEKIIVRPRSKTNLKKLQEAFHGDIPSRQFKAAFVPYTTPKGLPGAKPHHPKISYLAEGIAIDAGAYQRLFVPFNKKALVKNAEREIERVMSAMDGAELFFVQTGEFQTLNGTYAEDLTRKVVKYMNQYDGVKALPRSSGNAGDAPESHHWKYWLNGVVGYLFPKKLDSTKMMKQIYKGMQDAKARREVQDKKMRSVRKKK